MKVLNIENFSKSYGDKLVLHDLSFYINQQDMFAILGVNGAGKTSLLESIEGLRTYDGGQITFINNESFGVQLQSSTLPENMKVSEVIQLICKWNNNTNYKSYLETLDLVSIKDQMYKTLSTGQKRKLHLVLALINNSNILFLDEPTSGLDVEARADFHKLLRRLNKEGKTIIFSSHDMQEVESLCNRMIFIKDGEIKFFGDIEDFKKNVNRSYTVSIKPVHSSTYDIHTIHDITKDLFDLMSKYKQDNIEIEDLKITQPTLEDVFLQFIEEDKS